MFQYLFSLGILYWAVLSILCYKHLKKVFKKYKNFPRIQISQRHIPFVREDFGKWDQKALLKRSFTHFPLRFGAFSSSLLIYAALGTLNGLCKFPSISVINFFRKYYGKTAMRLIFNIKQQFDPNQKIQTAIVIANHSTSYDILYLGFCLKSIVSFVAKKEIEEIPVIKQLANFLQSILLDRSSAEARAKVRTDIQQRIKAFEKDNLNVFPLLIFPQGTFTNGRSLIQFKSGAFEALSPITIFCLRYQSKEFNLAEIQLNALDYMVLSLCSSTDLIVTKKVLKAVQNETVEQYSERCRKQLAEMGNFKTYNCNFKDYFQYYELCKKKIAELKKSTTSEQSS